MSEPPPADIARAHALQDVATYAHGRALARLAAAKAAGVPPEDVAYPPGLCRHPGRRGGPPPGLAGVSGGGEPLMPRKTRARAAGAVLAAGALPLHHNTPRKALAGLYRDWRGMTHA